MPDIQLSDKQLMVISTKDLNKRLKKYGIAAERCTEIKFKRRTMKNRGYAAQCRIKRENETAGLAQQIHDANIELAKYSSTEHYESVIEDIKAAFPGIEDEPSDNEDLDQDDLDFDQIEAFVREAISIRLSERQSSANPARDDKDERRKEFRDQTQ